jgi:hypothetical protein
MPYLKITYGSSHNIGVQGTHYIEVPDDHIPDDPKACEKYLDVAWQEAVNEYMNDTTVEIVGEEGA